LQPKTALISGFCALDPGISITRVSKKAVFKMKCKFCHLPCRRSGRQKNGGQRHFCKGCSRYQLAIYRYRACDGAILIYIRSLSCESVGIRGIARVLGKATGTVSSRIRILAKEIKRPVLEEKETFEVDEL